jgi:hypothetical protein
MLELNELQLVGGGEGECTASDGGNSYGGVVETGDVGPELVNLYEGAVAAMSHVIERVADAL